MASREINKQWFVDRLAHRGRTMAEWAGVLDLHPSRITDLLNGERELRVDEQDRTAAFLGATGDEILMHLGYKRKQIYSKLPISGYIDATSGSVVVRMDTGNEPLEYVEVAIPYDGRLVRIKGSSMSPRYRDGEIIGYRPNGADISTLIGEEVVVETEDGRRLLKILQRGTIPDHYTLVSLNRDDAPIVNVELRLAALIDIHLPRRL